MRSIRAQSFEAHHMHSLLENSLEERPKSTHGNAYFQTEKPFNRSISEKMAPKGRMSISENTYFNTSINERANINGPNGISYSNNSRRPTLRNNFIDPGSRKNTASTTLSLPPVKKKPPSKNINYNRSNSARFSISTGCKSAKSDAGRHSSVGSELGSDDVDSSSEVLSPTMVLRPKTAWESFEEHVKQVNDSSLLLHFNQNAAKFKSSDAFQRVMDDVRPKKEEMSVKARRRTTCSILAGGDDESLNEYILKNKKNNRSNSQRLVGLRGWNILRMKVEEMKMQNRQSQTSFTWNFLRHTISQMTDMERAREKLYAKYIYHEEYWADGLKHIPEHLTRKLAKPELKETVEQPEKEKKVDFTDNIHGRKSWSATSKTSPRNPKLRRRKINNSLKEKWL